MKSLLFLTAGLLVATAAAAPRKSEKKDDFELPKLIYCSNGIYSIIEASAVGNKEVVAARIKEGCDVNQKDENGDTALHLAVQKGAADCVSILLKGGADPMITNAEGKTALQISKSRKVQKLLKKAMELREKEMKLCEQIQAGNLEALKQAIKQKNFNPNMQDKENKLSLLMLVCQKGGVDDVQSLIKAGADVNFISPDSRSVLHKAVDSDNADIITALLEAGANPMAKAGNEAVPMHDAVWSARMESIKALMPAYKDMNYSPPGGFNGTPINLAIDRGHMAVVQLFIEAGIDLNNNKHGELPLLHAAGAGKGDFVEYLLKAGASKTATDQHGKTAKDVATDAVRHLL